MIIIIHTIPMTITTIAKEKDAVVNMKETEDTIGMMITTTETVNATIATEKESVNANVKETTGVREKGNVSVKEKETGIVIMIATEIEIVTGIVIMIATEIEEETAIVIHID